MKFDDKFKIHNLQIHFDVYNPLVHLKLMDCFLYFLFDVNGYDLGGLTNKKTFIIK